MKPFEYGDGEIGEREILCVVASCTIAVGVLFIPRNLAGATNFFDGWLALVITGIFTIFFTGVITQLTSRFPNQTFFTYASAICSKPVASVITICFAIHYMVSVSYQTRFVAIVAKQYLLDQTPAEIISLLFLLVVVYAVSGSRIGVIRLNVLFLPIILFISLLVLGMNIPKFEPKNLSPLFTTGLEGYWKGSKESFFALVGSDILLFYVAFVNKPKKITKYAMIGAGIPLGLYLLIYMMAIGVFTAETTATLVYPTIELAKEAETPGGFLGRIESLFFMIWIMTIFNTASLYLDAGLIALSSLFQKVKKRTFIFLLTPFIYLIAMLPTNLIEVNVLGSYINYSLFGLGILIPTALLLLAKARGIKGNE
ncbi:spore germination protein [Ectobacillus funiculus]|uniref:GerAB/ArcD/ProY family transporter n=1 Tax=Ectobacillus funiculus TaxID=137993 RepID=UPI0039792C03